MSDRQNLETRMTELKALIARRIEQQVNQRSGVDPGRLINSLKEELRNVAVEYVALRCGNGGGWEALDIIERMRVPVSQARADFERMGIPLPTPAPVPDPIPDPIRHKLREFLATRKDRFVQRSDFQYWRWKRK